MAIGGSPPNAPREKDGAKGTAGRYGFVAEVLRGYLGSLWLARDPSDATEHGTVFVRHLAPIHTASARGAILEAARFGQAAGGSTLEIIEGRTSVDLVTPFVDAEPLRSLLRTAALKHVPLDPGVLLGIARNILEDIGSLHDAARANKSAHGFGGLTPDSVLLGTDGHVELIDAGVAAATSAREPWKSDVQRIGYFAPEQLDMRGVVDARTDVFGLGILLWEAFGNRRLFPGADGKSARERVQKGAIPRLDATRTSNSPGISTPVADLVARALERDPAKRFQSAEEMQAAIGALEPASAERIGAWVTSLAETAITKRRQLLARSSVAPIPARTSLLPTRPSVSPGPGTRASLVPARPPLRTGTPAVKTASGPPAAARAPSSPPVAVAESDTRPAAPETDAIAVAADAKAPSLGPPEVAADAKAATPSPAEPVAEASLPPSAIPDPASETPEPPAERPARELGTATTASEEPVSVEALAVTSSDPVPAETKPSAEPEPTKTGDSEASAAASPAPSSATPESSVPLTQPSADASSEPAKAPSPSDADADADAMDVTDDDLAAPPPPSPRPAPPSAGQSLRPSPRSSLPPRLPHDTTPSSTPVAGGDTSLLGAPAEPLAGPMPAVSQLTVLTSPAAPQKRGLYLAVGAALALGVGVGGWWRMHGAKQAKEGHSPKPVLEAHVESVTLVAEPSASAQQNAAAPPPSAEPGSAAAPPVSAEPPAPPAPSPNAPSAEVTAPTRPSADVTKPPQPSAEQSASHTASPSTTPSPGAATAPHRPPPSRGPANSGYKPGGI